MTDFLVRVEVPGSVYSECFDPQVSGYAEMVGLPVAQSKRRGKGRQWIYYVTREQAEDMLRWAADVAAPFRLEKDPYLKRVVRAIDRWLDQHRVKEAR